MKNWAPLIIVLLFIALLAVIFGPGIYRRSQLRSAVTSLVEAAREGRTTDIVAMVEPGQQQEVAMLLKRHLPPDYAKSIDSLRLSRTVSMADNKAITILTCKVVTAEMYGIYQGQLVWHYTGGHWEWDFMASAGAEFSPSGEPSWVRLTDLMPLAEKL